MTAVAEPRRRPPLAPSAYCLQCARVTAWRLVAHVDDDRPPATTYRCDRCGYRRLKLADVTDAMQLARLALDRIVDASGLAREGTRFDYWNALGHMFEAVWLLYLKWDPTRGVTFTAYASGLLPSKFRDLQRQTLGRGAPKPLAIAVSLDAPLTDGDGETGGLDGAVAASGGDPAVDRDPDLARLLARRGRGGPERDAAAA